VENLANQNLGFVGESSMRKKIVTSFPNIQKNSEKFLSMTKKASHSTNIKPEIDENLHIIPSDLKLIITANVEVNTLWDDLTPLARNEWICWVLSAKLAETRLSRIDRVSEMLLSGKRRPCCWPGCPHRSKKGKTEKNDEK
jgi:uncharacterized protein YdeI (YjbR/CyaY-like superfamily)